MSHKPCFVAHVRQSDSLVVQRWTRISKDFSAFRWISSRRTIFRLANLLNSIISWMKNERTDWKMSVNFILKVTCIHQGPLPYIAMNSNICGLIRFPVAWSTIYLTGSEIPWSLQKTIQANIRAYIFTQNHMLPNWFRTIQQ